MKILRNHLLLLVLTNCAYSQQILNILPVTYIKSTSTSLKCNPDYLINVTCKLKAVNWERSDLHIELDIVQVLRNLTVRMELFKYTNQFRPFLINLTTNYCDLFKNGHINNAYIKTLSNIVARFSNGVHKCPYLKGHFYVRDAYVDASMLPYYIPPGKYRTVLTFFEDWPLIKIGIFYYVYEVKEKIKRQELKEEEHKKIK